MSATELLKKRFIRLLVLIVILFLAWQLYEHVLSGIQTNLSDIDTELVSLCMSEQEEGAPYYALYAISETYNILPDKALSMLKSAGESNAFYEKSWPDLKQIEQTFIDADAEYMKEYVDEDRAKEAAEFCNSLKKLDNVINGAFPLDKTEKYNYSDTFGAERTYGGERTHEGTDIICDSGTPVYSVTDGTVIKKGWNRLGGWRLLIRDSYGLEYYYAHLSEYAVDIDEGDTVLRGQLIGYSGASGYGETGTTGQFVAHLHFGIYENGTAINPYYYLKKCEKNAS